MKILQMYVLLSPWFWNPKIKRRYENHLDYVWKPKGLFLLIAKQKFLSRILVQQLYDCFSPTREELWEIFINVVELKLELELEKKHEEAQCIIFQDKEDTTGRHHWN